MNKKMEEIKKRLDEIVETKNNAGAIRKKNITEARAKIEELEKVLKKTDSLETYQALKEEKAKAEEVLDFYNTNKGANASNLPLEECKEMSAEIVEEIRTIQNSYYPKIEKIINSFVDVMNDYTAETEELERLKVSVERAAGLPVASGYITRDIMKGRKDPLFWNFAIIDAYFNHKSEVIAGQAIAHGQRGSFANARVNAIARNIKEGGKYGIK